MSAKTLRLLKPSNSFLVTSKNYESQVAIDLVYVLEQPYFSNTVNRFVTKIRFNLIFTTVNSGYWPLALSSKFGIGFYTPKLSDPASVEQKYSTKIFNCDTQNKDFGTNSDNRKLNSNPIELYLIHNSDGTIGVDNKLNIEWIWEVNFDDLGIGNFNCPGTKDTIQKGTASVSREAQVSRIQMELPGAPKLKFWNSEDNKEISSFKIAEKNTQLRFYKGWGEDLYLKIKTANNTWEKLGTVSPSTFSTSFQANSLSNNTNLYKYIPAGKDKQKVEFKLFKGEYSIEASKIEVTLCLDENLTSFTIKKITPTINNDTVKLKFEGGYLNSGYLTYGVFLKEADKNNNSINYPCTIYIKDSSNNIVEKAVSLNYASNTNPQFNNLTGTIEVSLATIFRSDFGRKKFSLTLIDNKNITSDSVDFYLTREDIKIEPEVSLKINSVNLVYAEDSENEGNLVIEDIECTIEGILDNIDNKPEITEIYFNYGLTGYDHFFKIKNDFKSTVFIKKISLKEDFTFLDLVSKIKDSNSETLTVWAVWKLKDKTEVESQKVNIKIKKTVNDNKPAFSWSGEEFQFNVPAKQNYSYPLIIPNRTSFSGYDQKDNMFFTIPLGLPLSKEQVSSLKNIKITGSFGVLALNTVTLKTDCPFVSLNNVSPDACYYIENTSMITFGFKWSSLTKSDDNTNFSTSPFGEGLKQITVVVTTGKTLQINF